MCKGGKNVYNVKNNWNARSKWYLRNIADGPLKVTDRLLELDEIPEANEMLERKEMPKVMES